MKTEAADLKYILAIHRAMSLTFLRYTRLSQFFQGDWGGAFQSSISELQEAGIDAKGIENFLLTREKVNPDQELEQVEKFGIKVLLYGEDGYPSPLENMSTSPAILFCRGEIKETDFPSISVVGSRKMTTYGQMAIEKIVGEIAESGVTIVSGLAMGVDGEAHKIALKKGGRTIAVLGSAIDEIYPRQNFSLAEKILIENQGAIISEYLPGTESRPEFFPIRNRIIAGLSKATIIIEAAEASGSLITAQMANDQGREIFSVPGDIFSPSSAGANQIILDGTANPALSGTQILEDLGFDRIADQKKAKQEIPATGIEAEILKLFAEGEKVHLDDLMRNSQLPNATVSSNILILEVKGLVKNLGNQVYARNF